MKQFLILPLAMAVLAACATSNETPQSTAAACGNLSGATYLECQKQIQPASSTDKPFKMVKPKPVNGKAGRNGPMKDHSNL